MNRIQKLKVELYDLAKRQGEIQQEFQGIEQAKTTLLEQLNAEEAKQAAKPEAATKKKK